MIKFYKTLADVKMLDLEIGTKFCLWNKQQIFIRTRYIPAECNSNYALLENIYGQKYKTGIPQ